MLPVANAAEIEGLKKEQACDLNSISTSLSRPVVRTYTDSLKPNLLLAKVCQIVYHTPSPRKGTRAREMAEFVWATKNC